LNVDIELSRVTVTFGADAEHLLTHFMTIKRSRHLATVPTPGEYV